MDTYTEDFDRVESGGAPKATRKSVATNIDEIEFTDERPFYEQRRKQLVPVTYVENAPTRKTNKKNKTIKGLIYKIGWWFCFFLALRLVFAKRGILDYFAMEGILNNKREELEAVRRDNRSVISDIKRITENKSHQKSLAREHLGVISEDEHLILFAQEKLPTSR